MLKANVPTGFNKCSFDDLAGEIALAEGQLQSAANSFKTATSEYPRFTSHEGLARTYEAEQDWASAVSEWRQVIASRGEIFRDFSPSDWVLSHLHAAVVYQRLGDAASRDDEYKQFVFLWKDADDFEARVNALKKFREHVR